MAVNEFRPIATVDVALFTVRDAQLCVVLRERDKPPFRGKLALIGGSIEAEEDRDMSAAAVRTLKSATGLGGLSIEQLMTFSGPERDPRGWSVSVAYLALVSDAALALAKGKAALSVLPVDRVPKLAFDHARIVAGAVSRIRDKDKHSSLPALLLPMQFTMTQLKSVYASALGAALDYGALRRTIDDLQIVEATTGAKSGGKVPPDQLYRLGRPQRSEAVRPV